jgi:predicted enzyme related to lactoylglutathione lyase
MELRVCVDVSDLETAIAFYRDALGLRPGRRLSTKWAEMLGAAVPLDLLANEAGTRPVPESAALRDYARHWTPVHFDVAVEDIEAAVARAVKAGARVDQAIKAKRWGKLAVLADPFGNGFCFLQFAGRGYDELLSP